MSSGQLVRWCTRNVSKYVSAPQRQNVKNYVPNKAMTINHTRPLSELVADFKCWNCKFAHACEIVCPSCHKIQCTSCTTQQLNYFQIFKLKEKFDLNVQQYLKPYYIKLQSSLHPDKFVSTSQMEKDYSTTQSALVNEAFKTLSEPLQRGLYILKLHGYELESEAIDNRDDSFLNQVFLLNFQVDECESIEELSGIASKLDKDIESDLDDINDAFEGNDFERARSGLVRLKYRTNIRQTIDEKSLEMSL